MTSTVLLRLAGPMQSWGSVGSSDLRTTELAPTRSGLEGMLAAAFGAPRGVIPDDVRALDIMVRVDRPGRIEWDFHTVTPVPDDAAAIRGRQALIAQTRPSADPIAWQVSRGTTKWALGKEIPTMLSRRAYLADAEFIVALTGDDDVIERVLAALRNPVWSPYLGRKAYAPTFPFILGTREGAGGDVLREEPTEADGRLRLLRIEGPRAISAGHVTPAVKDRA